MTKSRNVVFLGLESYSLVGGLQAFNRRLIENLSSICIARGFKAPTILCMGDQTSDFTANFPAKFKGFGRNRIKFIRSAIAAVRDCDLLLVGHVNLLLVAFICRVLRPTMPIILFVHGDEVWNSELRKKKFFEPLLLNYITTVASVSQYTARVMAREFSMPLSKTCIFPNAVTVPTGRSSELAKTVDVICVTRMGAGDRRKNVDVLLKAIAILKAGGKVPTLSIVGDGALRQELQKLAHSLNISEEVRFLGRVSDDQLESAYRSAKIFCLPSSKEGFGIVYLEAWLRKLPVICGKKGAPSEIVDDEINGLVVDEENPAELASRIRWLLEHEEKRVAMGEAGCAKVLAQYSNERSRLNLEALLDGFGITK